MRKNYEPAPVTLGRVTRFYQLLCDLGYADLLDVAAAEAQPELPTGRPVTIAEQVEASQAREVPEATLVRIDLARIYRAIAEGGALQRLGAILFDCTEEEADEIEAAALEGALVPFAVASFALIELLANSLSGSV